MQEVHHEELEKRFRENDIPFEKIQTVSDVLQDQEAFDNDQLRYMKYEKQGPSSPYGEEEDYVITTMPFRLDSIGDPVLHRSVLPVTTRAQDPQRLRL